MISAVLLIVACGGSSKNGGNAPSEKDMTLLLVLPMDIEGVCGKEESYDQTYCITPDDNIIVSVYAKDSLTDEYRLIEDKNLSVKSNGMDSVALSFELAEKHSYLRLFVKVTNGKKIKLTGGADNITKNSPKIFLAPAGDFVRVVANRSNHRNDYESLKSYFDDDGSKGSASVALKDGSIYMAGGYDTENGEITKKAAVFDMKNISGKNVENLPVPLYDHIAALLDDGSETGKVVVGLGKTVDGLINELLWLYDPESDKYSRLSDIQAVTKAKAITIDGNVYIVGGCTENGASAGVYKISAEDTKVESFATLKQGRCNHAIADVSTENEVRILVIGGSTNYKPEGYETPVLGENFAELVTAGTSKPLDISDRNGTDDAELKTKGLISPAASGIVMDDKEKNETVVSVLGGYILNDKDSWVTNPYLFVFSSDKEKLVYDKNGTPFKCARPSAAVLSSGNKSPLQYVAVNCGSDKLERRKNDSAEQRIFVVQIKRTTDSNLSTEILSSSVKESLMESNTDIESDGLMIDGSVAADALGRVFMFGGKYVYAAGSYTVPGTPAPHASVKLPPEPIIHVEFKSPFEPPASYRNILDQIQMDLAGTCVSDPDAPGKCLKDWEKAYYIRYKWEMVETPTPLSYESQLTLVESEESTGTWIPDNGKKADPKTASFRSLMITPRRDHKKSNPDYDAEKCSSECGSEPVDDGDRYFFRKISDYFICHQKYCEKSSAKYYKVNIQAETVDKETGFSGDTAEVTVVPKIIPQARVVAQLSWDQGFRTKAESESKEGTNVDLDIHMIKRNSVEAHQYGFDNKDGLLGTRRRTPDLDSCPVTLSECEKFWRHDDCSFNDPGFKDEALDGRTIQWHASLDIDNTWGGGNYQHPETIGLDPVPEDDILNDQYLLVVGYVNCESKYSDGQDRCDTGYSGKGKAYTVDAQVQIFVDGEEVPRQGTSDSYAATTRDFKISLNDWKVVAVVKWDSGNTIVTDIKMENEGVEIDPVHHPVCTYDNADAELIPIWDANAYVNHITTPNSETGMIIGTCR